MARFEVIAPVAERWDRLPRAVRAVALLALLVLLVILPHLKIPVLNTPDSDFATVLFYPVGIYVLVALGLNVVVGEAGLLDLGYVAFFAVGGYSMGLLGNRVHWPFFLILPVGIALSMLAGVILGGPTLRLRGDYLAIVTLGFGEIVHLVARNTDSIGGPRGVSPIPHPPNFNLFGYHVRFGILDPKPYYYLLLAMIVLTIVVVSNLKRSRVGRAWTAIREDEDAAELMGVPTFRFKLWAFAIGAGIGGAAGVMYTSKVISISPDNFIFQLSILFLAAVVLGGSGNIPGVILGAAVVAYLPERFRSFAQYRIMVFGAALVVMMIFRPQGLLPSRRRAKELLEPEPGGGMGTLGGETGVEMAPRPEAESAP
ncbi:MAG: branched-chain amino acid transport system permease protein [Acidimicrobiaceae bacterium]|jgi:branched-chain amino acid transport system permease protein|nr:branched-chain amino acid transport system permease protein [Acidimicrobiaceae bacterium]